VDLETRTLVLSRNSHCPVLLFNPAWAGDISPDGWVLLNEPSEAIGIHARTKPVITELSLEPGIIGLMFTDGLWTAGERHGQRIAIAATVEALMRQGLDHPQVIADRVLAEAIDRDEGRPRDDMTLVVLGIRPSEHQDQVRRLSVSLPL
jgi:serine phosphatase RsbU (regulator of sigma subunit)